MVGLWFGHHFALHNYACSIAIGAVSISYLRAFSWSPSVSSFSSGQYGIAIQQYYGFNRLQLLLLAQGLLQSVLCHQVSVAMPYYSSVMVSIGIIQLWLSLLAQGLLQSVSFLQVSAWGNAILQYCYGFNRHHATVAQPLSTGSPSVSSFSSGECMGQCHTTVL